MILLSASFLLGVAVGMGLQRWLEHKQYKPLSEWTKDEE